MQERRPVTYGTDDLYFGMECDNQQHGDVESWSVIGGKYDDAAVTSVYF